MTNPELFAVGVGLLAAGALKGLTGIGFSTAALPFLVLATDLKGAMALVTLPAIAANAAILATGGSITGAVRRFWPFYAATVPGVVAGTMLLGAIDPGVALRLLVVATLAYVGLALARPDLSLSATAERGLKVPAGWINGVLTGLTGSQIMPLMPYMMALRMPPDDQVQAVNLAVTLASAMLLAALVSGGVVSASLAVLSAAGIVPALAGIAIGNALRSRLSQAAFRNLALATLALVALLLHERAGPSPKGRVCAEPVALVALAARSS